MEDLQEIQDRLQRRREELISRHRRLREDMRRQPADENPSYEDQGEDRELDDVIESRSELEMKEMRAIDEALTRIDEGIFGKCVHCRTPIPRERLRAIPTTLFCAPCAEDESRREKAGR